jgi:hypothetical protein
MQQLGRVGRPATDAVARSVQRVLPTPPGGKIRTPLEAYGLNPSAGIIRFRFDGFAPTRISALEGTPMRHHDR